MAEMVNSMAELTNINGKIPGIPGQKNSGRGGCHAGLHSARFAARALVVYRSLGQDALISELRSLLEYVDSDWPDLFYTTDLYCSVGNRLLRAGLGLKAYIIEKILHTENPFSIAAESMGTACLAGGSAGRWQAEAHDGSKDSGAASKEPDATSKDQSASPVLFGKALEEAVKSDLAKLQALAEVRSEWIRDAMLHLCVEDDAMREAVMKLPPWLGDNPSWQRKADGPDGAVAPDCVSLLDRDGLPGI
ncbi:MAG TPA: hypothetical protein PLG72_11235, partial [Clostridiales bacterium]|nr:hypothetical protein [Clostridiales bacterium]